VTVPAAPANETRPGRSARYPVTPWSEQRLYRPFVVASLTIGLLLGFSTGVGMLVALAVGSDRGLWYLTHAQSHGMVQIFGFAGLFTMGVAFHVTPRFRNGHISFPWPQRISLWLTIIAIVLRFTGQSVDAQPVSKILLVSAGVLLLLGYSSFGVTILRTLRTGAGPIGRAERWLYAGAFWAIAAAALHLWMMLWMADHETVFGRANINFAIMTAGLYGFVISIIMGVSNRAVVGFLGLRPTRPKLELPAYAAVQAGIALTVIAYILEASDKLTAAGMLLVAVGLIVFTIALRVLEPSGRRRPPITPGAYMHYHWFIRSAYVWLVVGAVLRAIVSIEVLGDWDILPVEYASPVLHVLTIGFVTSMIIGMGSRLLALFEGAVVPGRRLLDIAFVLIVLSVVTRVAFGFNFTSATDGLLGASGSAALLAVLLAVPALTGAMREKSRARYRELAAEMGQVKWANASLAQSATKVLGARRPGARRTGT